VLALNHLGAQQILVLAVFATWCFSAGGVLGEKSLKTGGFIIILLKTHVFLDPPDMIEAGRTDLSLQAIELTTLS